MLICFPAMLEILRYILAEHTFGAGESEYCINVKILVQVISLCDEQHSLNLYNRCTVRSSSLLGFHLHMNTVVICGDSNSPG